jgi:acyl-CoA thioesterase
MTDPAAQPWTTTRREAGVYASRFDASWYQGRGAFGGLVAAVCVDAMEREVGDPARALRTLSLQCCAPVQAGEALVRVETLRTGSRVKFVSSKIEQAGALVAFATASFAAARTQGVSYERRRPPASPPPASLAALPQGVAGAPTFLDHFEVRFGVGPLPFSGAAAPDYGAWVRLRRPATLDAAQVAMLLDSLPPAFWTTQTAPRPASTVDLTVSILSPLPDPDLTPADLLLVNVESRWAGEGYAEETRELWTEQGRCVAIYRQLLAILG